MSQYLAWGHLIQNSISLQATQDHFHPRHQLGTPLLQHQLTSTGSSQSDVDAQGVSSHHGYGKGTKENSTIYLRRPRLPEPTGRAFERGEASRGGEGSTVRHRVGSQNITEALGLLGRGTHFRGRARTNRGTLVSVPPLARTPDITMGKSGSPDPDVFPFKKGHLLAPKYRLSGLKWLAKRIMARSHILG